MGKSCGPGSTVEAGKGPEDPWERVGREGQGGAAGGSEVARGEGTLTHSVRHHWSFKLREDFLAAGRRMDCGGGRAEAGTG